jgi:hypothetical protein
MNQKQHKSISTNAIDLDGDEMISRHPVPVQAEG